MSDSFIGEIKIWANNFAPRDWTFCDGQLMPISQNPSLFSIIGTIYGGDGYNTMGIPNLKARVPMQFGNGPGLTSRQIGEWGGMEGVTLMENHIPSHNHHFSAYRYLGSQTTPDNTSFIAAAKKKKIYTDNPQLDTQMADQQIGSAGGSQPHENRQPFLAINFCIALTGVYPSRT